MGNLWSYKISRNTYSGTRDLVAVYVAETDSTAVMVDLSDKEGHLREYLDRFFNVDPDEYWKKYPLRTEALLGGLIANSDCLSRFGLWLDAAAPPAMKHAPVRKLGAPVAVIRGVKLWITERGVNLDEYG